MKYDSLFDIVGHIIVGPSSSHTAGACQIGYIAQNIFGKQPKNADISLHGSFAETYRGHHTDIALIGGLCGFLPDDERIRQSFKLAKERDLTFTFQKRDLGLKYHPNTVQIELYGKNKSDKLSVVGSSVGGGNVIIKEINGMTAGFNGDLFTLICIFNDNQGVFEKIKGIIAEFGLNTLNLHVSKNSQKQTALLWMESDFIIPLELIQKLEKISEILMVRGLNV
jgi:L-serine dehydratase